MRFREHLRGARDGAPLVVKLIRVGKACALTASIFDLRTESADRAASRRTKCALEGLMDAVDALTADLSL